MTYSKHNIPPSSPAGADHHSASCSPHKRRKTEAADTAITVSSSSSSSDPTQNLPPKQAQTHRIMTRSRTRIFRFLDLPAELRNQIYEYAFGRTEPTPLPELRLPSGLRACRTLYTEARPLFFLTTPVAVHVRCNWCVLYHHLHSEHHLRYDETGRIMGGAIPPMLRGHGALPSAIARFRTVRFNIQCCCCDQPKVIANMHVRVVAGAAGGVAGAAAATVKAGGGGIGGGGGGGGGGEEEGRGGGKGGKGGGGGLIIVARAEVMNGPKICPKVVEGLFRMFEDAEAAMTTIGKRPEFSGLTIGDLELVAKCFREEGEAQSDSGSDL